MKVISCEPHTAAFQIRFRPSCFQDQSVAFPCDEQGVVDMDRLSEAGRREYLFARIMTRLEHARPELVRVPLER